MKLLAVAGIVVLAQAVVERPSPPKGPLPPHPPEALANSAASGGIPVGQAVCGALLREGFRTPFLHPQVWTAFAADPAVTYAIRDGVVRVFEGEREAASAAVDAEGLVGLYPGDTWQISLRGGKE